MRAEIDAEADQFLGPFVTLTVVGRQRPRDPAETDSLAEGNGFELPVRGCDESGFRSFCVALDCSRLNSIDDLRKGHMTRIALCVIAALVLSLSACTNPYDPVQRGFAGGLWGAASGAAIGAAAGGGPGAALGAVVGGATGIFGGVASTPPPPPGTYYGYPAYGYPAYGYPGYPQSGSGYSAYPGYGYPGYGYPGNYAYRAY